MWISSQISELFLSESFSTDTDDSDSKSNGSSDTDGDTNEGDLAVRRKKPVGSKQRGRAVYICMYIVYMLLVKACYHNQFVWDCITIQSFFNYTQAHSENNIFIPIYFALIFFNSGDFWCEFHLKFLSFFIQALETF